MAEEHSQGFWKGEDELSMRKTEEYFLIQVFGKEKCSLLAAGGAGHSLRSLLAHATGGIDKTLCRRRGGNSRDRSQD